ncbi:MAG: hypothetical protein ACK4Z5_05335, partial [Brevundimonas sp.]
MRIAHVITRFIRGGADENTLLSCNAQAAAGDDVHLIHGCAFNPAMLARLDPRVTQHLAPSLRRAIHPLRDLRTTIALTALLRRIRPDVVHT